MAKPKKTKLQALLHPVRFKSQRKDGTLRLVRDGYSNSKQSWWDIRAKVLQRDGGRCTAMLETPKGRARCPHTESLDVHHVKELSGGGRTVMSNLITLCRTCHQRRHRHAIGGSR